MSHALTQDITQLPTPPAATDGIMVALERLARDPQIPTERITELFRLAERREQTLLHRAFHLDMNALQAELTQVAKDKPNPAFRSKYATYEALDRVARPLYTQYGFDITFGTAPPSRPDHIMVVCKIGHRMGYFEEHSLEGPVSTQGSQGGRAGATPIQAVGIAVSYLKRYLLQMVLNLVTSDDPTDNDGNPNVSSDPLAKYADWLLRFEQAAKDIADSDAAKELLERETVVKMITEMPSGELKRRFMEVRAEISKLWLQPIDGARVDNAPENKSEKIEGLD